ncbi:MAG: ribose-phosphate diphosphokinase [Dehalococcoidia bacterium]|tara:strand:+ start:1464 stop:2414 length:951 start_codon:yes stop_codon:yes gene_type:complete
MPSFEDLRIFSGNSHPKLASDICDYLRIPLGECDVFKFSNDNTFVSFKENVRERDVFLVQTFCRPVNDHIMELLVMIDAAKRASAGRITAVIPHYSYGRSDKKDQPRVPITARLVANLLTVAGADRVLTVDLHAGQIQGFFNIPVDELSAVQMLAGHFKSNGIGIEVASATDAGDVKRTRDTARFLNVGMSLVEKHRIGNEDRVEAVSLIGDVKDKTALIVDDELGTGGTVIATAQALKEHGAKDIYCAVTHPVLSGEASNILAQSEVIETVVTDTLPVPDAKRGSKLTVLSIAPMLGEAIHRIHGGLSVGAMFES